MLSVAKTQGTFAEGAYFPVGEAQKTEMED